MLLTVAAEGLCDLEAARKLIAVTGHAVEREFNCRGKGNFDKRLAGFVSACEHFDWVILRDLDHDATCAPQLLEQLVPRGIPNRLTFRVIVRSLESWLFADHKELASWLQMSSTLIPQHPEDLADPKSEMALLARRSRDRHVRERMAPDPSSGARVGPEYEATLLEFIRDRWSPLRAIQGGRSDSLLRAASALRAL